MLCYYYPPAISSGVARSVGFSRYLGGHGWKPTVLTVRESKEPWAITGAPEPEQTQVVRAAEINLHGAVNLFHGAASRIARLFGRELKINLPFQLCVPDPQIAWRATSEGIALARQHDAIYVSCSPFSSVLKGCRIKRATGKPLVLDFRDPWPAVSYGTRIALHRRIAGRMERRAIGLCDRLILNTEGARRMYVDRYPDQAHKMVTIYNGFEGPLPSPAPGRRRELFTIMHLGTFYGGRKPDLLLETLSELNAPSIRFVQVGSGLDVPEPYTGRVNVEVVPPMSRDDALRLMASADMLYLKQADDENVAVAAKTFEYLASGIPVLAETPEGENAEIIRKYATKAFVVGSGSKREMSEAILSVRDRREEIAAGPTPEFVEAFSRENLTKQLVDVLNSCVDSNKVP